VKPVTARRYLISGRVQGVGFRYFAERAAKEIGVTGWARNLDNGAVEVLANGTLRQLDDFEARLRQGPPLAEVRSFDAAPAAPTEAAAFHIR
jgi:acylphosphatase